MGARSPPTLLVAHPRQGIHSSLKKTGLRPSLKNVSTSRNMARHPKLSAPAPPPQHSGADLRPSLLLPPEQRHGAVSQGKAILPSTSQNHSVSRGERGASRCTRNDRGSLNSSRKCHRSHRLPRQPEPVGGPAPCDCPVIIRLDQVDGGGTPQPATSSPSFRRARASANYTLDSGNRPRVG